MALAHNLQENKNFFRKTSVTVFCGSVLLFSLVGCGNPLGGAHSAIDASHLPGVDNGKTPVSKIRSEFVAASSQMKPTVTAKFLLEASLSTSTNEINETTTRGYKLYSNVQGQLISDGQGL
jgi:hypothetical protein